MGEERVGVGGRVPVISHERMVNVYVNMIDKGRRREEEEEEGRGLDCRQPDRGHTAGGTGPSEKEQETRKDGGDGGGDDDDGDGEGDGGDGDGDAADSERVIVVEKHKCNLRGLGLEGLL